MKEYYEGLIASAGATGAGLRKLRDLTDPMVLEMLNYWYAKRGERLMPSPSDMNPVDFARHMPHLMMIQVDHDPFMLTYRLVGEEVAHSHGVNLRGRPVLDVNERAPHLGAVLHELYKAVAALRRPVGVGGNMKFAGRGHMTFEAAYMPLSVDGERTDRIFTATSYRPLSVAERFATEMAEA
ncbi:MAG: PAS domain-containing protein [Parvibaculum sp.]|uniref:PAS domain-containing protein n=1 Tax=Parvibaculum sp. TaxID=2024848 RepID=UPI0025F2793A|nr:PAS domain-containing protein [Parvibaculum sp.]MCE9650427.1 PAS domain-containing protein [Parvibaculum sp.]